MAACRFYSDTLVSKIIINTSYEKVDLLTYVLVYDTFDDALKY